VTWWNKRSLTALADISELKEPMLHTAPVEAWETRLYWMARIQERLSARKGQKFESSRRGRVATVTAYLAAGLAQRVLTPQPTACGATSILVGRRQV